MARTTSSAATRDRILTATIELFRRQGYNGTSLSQVVEASAATTGSIYHFFPGGKDDLAAEVLRVSGAGYGELAEAIVRSAVDVSVGMHDAFVGAAGVLAETDFIDPCPIGTVAREVASTNDALREVAAEVMVDWIDRLGAVMVQAGIAPDEARRLASFGVTAIEGGFVLARTLRSVDPLLEAAEVVRGLVAAALAEV